MASFEDHFSNVARDYARGRPSYPRELFEWIAVTSPARTTAWDCATGNGQAAREMAAHFARVIATDGSRAQLANATRDRDNVRFVTALAEAPPLADHSIDCTAVAQAAHWFDLPRFLAEVERVSRRGALLVMWCYDLARVSPPVDAVVERYYHDVVGRFWPARRGHIETGYRELDVPFPAVPAPPFSMTQSWGLAELRAYLATWSSSQRYRDALGFDPLDEIDRELGAAWGDARERKDVVWPLHVRASRIGA